jgi:hypothetical protein
VVFWSRHINPNMYPQTRHRCGYFQRDIFPAFFPRWRVHARFYCAGTVRSLYRALEGVPPALPTTGAKQAITARRAPCGDARFFAPLVRGQHGKKGNTGRGAFRPPDCNPGSFKQKAPTLDFFLFERLSHPHRKGGGMNTLFFLMAQYNAAVIPLDLICRDYFQHLKPEKFVQKALAGEIVLPVVCMEGSQKTAKGVPLVDFAAYLDKQIAAARKECEQLKRSDAA